MKRTPKKLKTPDAASDWARSKGEQLPEAMPNRVNDEKGTLARTGRRHRKLAYEYVDLLAEAPATPEELVDALGQLTASDRAKVARLHTELTQAPKQEKVVRAKVLEAHMRAHLNQQLAAKEAAKKQGLRQAHLTLVDSPWENIATLIPNFARDLKRIATGLGCEDEATRALLDLCKAVDRATQVVRASNPLWDFQGGKRWDHDAPVAVQALQNALSLLGGSAGLFDSWTLTGGFRDYPQLGKVVLKSALGKHGDQRQAPSVEFIAAAVLARGVTIVHVNGEVRWDATHTNTYHVGGIKMWWAAKGKVAEEYHLPALSKSNQVAAVCLLTGVFPSSMSLRNAVKRVGKAKATIRAAAIWVLQSHDSLVP